VTILKRFRDDQAGATVIEYALIAAFLALAIIGALTSVGNTLSTRLSNIATIIANGG
jgi:pilus assembly protein Flp/PilA